MSTATANDVAVKVSGADLLSAPHPEFAHTVLAGDIFYQRDIAELALQFLSGRAADGASVLIGDPGRSYLPKDRLTQLAQFGVPVSRDLEDAEIKNTSVWTLR